MEEVGLIPHLFRTEYSKMVAVLSKKFGLQYIEIAEDIVSDTFLSASELWGQKGIPVNPTGWLYTVAQNKTKDFLKRDQIFINKISKAIIREGIPHESFSLDLSDENIKDSQLKMMFSICHPCLPIQSQIALSLHILCGFGADEIAEALLVSKESIYKKLLRGKAKLKSEKIKLELPSSPEIHKRLDSVLITLYLLFSEGYYSTSQKHSLRKDLCVEAIRLAYLLADNEFTSLPKVNALLALMCFHSSRFDARYNNNNDMILYDDQDKSLWNDDLIKKGEFYLNRAAKGEVTKFHLEAGIAFWHTRKFDHPEKWENILQYYNKLLLIEYSPLAALNRTYAVSQAYGIERGIEEAEKLKLTDNYLYHCLLGDLYKFKSKKNSLSHFNTAISLTKSLHEKKIISHKIEQLKFQDAD